MNNPLSLLFPAINVVVTGAFAAVILRQYFQRHKLYQLYWSIALLMAFAATLGYVLMIVVQPTSTAGIILFRVYYIFGASLMPSWLGLGSMALVSKPAVTRYSFITLCWLSAVAIVLVGIAGIDMRQLSQVAGTPGAGILQPQNGAWLFVLIILNSLGVLAVVGVAIYSGWKLIARQGPGNLLWGNVLILAGDLINAAAGSGARLGVENIFWLIMTVGWVVFFMGVILVSRRRAVTPPQKVEEEKLQTVPGS
ncbi:MAG: hypothetical protein WCD86_20525 [Ktedonobacteraceae bacterium]|nr:hypothetical protein [Ktedonobacteraceae bacterium]